MRRQSGGCRPAPRARGDRPMPRHASGDAGRGRKPGSRSTRGHRRAHSWPWPAHLRAAIGGTAAATMAGLVAKARMVLDDMANGGEAPEYDPERVAPWSLA